MTSKDTELGQLLQLLEMSKLKVLLEILPNLKTTVGLAKRFKFLVGRILEETNVAKLGNHPIDNNFSVDVEGIVAYYDNVEDRMRRSYHQLISEKGEGKLAGTHAGIDHGAYLEMLHARYLATTPILPSSFPSRSFESIVDLGGGPGTAIQIAKQYSIVKRGYLVDREDTVNVVKDSRFEEYIDGFFIGDLTQIETLWNVSRECKRPSIWILSDVLHGRSQEDRMKIYLNLAPWLLLKDAPTIIIREFHGFTALDSLLFNIQLRMFTDGELLFVKELEIELDRIGLSIELLHNEEFYYYGKLSVKDTASISIR